MRLTIIMPKKWIHNNTVGIAIYMIWNFESYCHPIGHRLIYRTDQTIDTAYILAHSRHENVFFRIDNLLSLDCLLVAFVHQNACVCTKLINHINKPKGWIMMLIKLSSPSESQNEWQKAAPYLQINSHRSFLPD